MMKPNRKMLRRPWPRDHQSREITVAMQGFLGSMAILERFAGDSQAAHACLRLWVMNRT